MRRFGKQHFCGVFSICLDFGDFCFIDDFNDFLEVKVIDNSKVFFTDFSPIFYRFNQN